MVRESFPHLEKLSSGRLIFWISALAKNNPELLASFDFLGCIISCTDGHSAKRLISHFIGPVRSLSSASCQKYSIKVHVLVTILQDEGFDRRFRVFIGYIALKKLLKICCNAEDKNHVFKPVVIQLAHEWRSLILSIQTRSSSLSNKEKAFIIFSDAQHINHLDSSQATLSASHLISSKNFDISSCGEMLFELMSADECSILPSTFWLYGLSRIERTELGRLSLDAVNSLQMLLPSRDLGRRSYEHRWLRIRLMTFLEYFGFDVLLAELSAKSAINDEEAATAASRLWGIGKSRDAINLALQWLKLHPSSKFILSQLYKIYSDDGWTDDANEILSTWSSYYPGKSIEAALANKT